MEDCSRHCYEYDMGQERAWSYVWGGWAMVEQGATAEGILQIQKHLATCRTLGSRLAFSECLTLLAQTFGKAGRIDEGLAAVAEAMELAPQMAEGYFKAETQRIKGELFLQTKAEGREVGAEACFQEAITIARQQSAKSWELRASMSWARLWQKQGKREEARALLGEIYGWFAEGLDTADLKEAKALLENLR